MSLDDREIEIATDGLRLYAKGMIYESHKKEIYEIIEKIKNIATKHTKPDDLLTEDEFDSIVLVLKGGGRSHLTWPDINQIIEKLRKLKEKQ